MVSICGWSIERKAAGQAGQWVAMGGRGARVARGARKAWALQWRDVRGKPCGAVWPRTRWEGSRNASRGFQVVRTTPAPLEAL